MQFMVGQRKIIWSRCGKNEEVKQNTIYLSADNNVIEEKEVVRDLVGVPELCRPVFPDLVDFVGVVAVAGVGEELMMLFCFGISYRITE